MTILSQSVIEAVLYTGVTMQNINQTWFFSFAIKLHFSVDFLDEPKIHDCRTRISYY